MLLQNGAGLPLNDYVILIVLNSSCSFVLFIQVIKAIAINIGYTDIEEKICQWAFFTKN